MYVVRAAAGVYDPNALTVNGKSMGENVSSAECFNREVIYTYDAPLQKEAGIAVLKVHMHAFTQTACTIVSIP